MLDLKAHCKHLPLPYGAELACYLEWLAGQLQPASTIIELGPGLGGYTAHILKGLRERTDKHNISLVCVDDWVARKEQHAVVGNSEIEIAEGMNLLPVVDEISEGFGFTPEYRGGKRIFLKESTSFISGFDSPVSLVVADNEAPPDEQCHVIDCLLKNRVKGETVFVLKGRLDGEKPAASPFEIFLKKESDNLRLVYAGLAESTEAWLYV